MSKKRKYYTWGFWVAVVLLSVSSFVYFWNSNRSPVGENVIRNIQGESIKERTLRNYSEEVYRIAEKEEVSYAYLMALISLECSGNKPAGNRYEKHVHNRLREVQEGSLRRYENIKKSTIADASDEALKNLATSWGAFQLMGYKCVGLGVNVKDIRGEDGLEHGVRWIKEEYGRFLKKGKFKDAFHYHNTGRKFPRDGVSRTHDPRYVDKGLAYMEFFEANPPTR